MIEAGGARDDFSSGARYALAGLQLITKPGIRRFVLIPLAINVLVFIAAFTLLGLSIEYVMDQLLPGWLDEPRRVPFPILPPTIHSPARPVLRGRLHLPDAPRSPAERPRFVPEMREPTRKPTWEEPPFFGKMWW